MLHYLKIDKAHYEAVSKGVKQFEVRNNKDRGFQKGDLVILNEIDHLGVETRRSIQVEISYVTNYNQPANQVVFGFSIFCETGK